MVYLTINSKNKSSSNASTSDFSIRLSIPMKYGKYVKLKEVTIPHSIYRIKQGVNDKVVWNQGGAFSATISPGAYGITQLLAAITTAMNGADANSYVWTYDSVTFKTTVTGSSAFSLIWGTATNASTSMWKELGFTQADTSSATSQTSPNSIALYAPIDAFIIIPQVGYSGVMSSNLYYTFKFTLASANSGEIVSWSSASFFEQEVQSSQGQLTQLDIRLVDESGNILDLNGLDWSFTLEITE